MATRTQEDPHQALTVRRLKQEPGGIQENSVAAPAAPLASSEARPVMDIAVHPLPYAALHTWRPCNVDVKSGRVHIGSGAYGNTP